MIHHFMENFKIFTEWIGHNADNDQNVPESMDVLAEHGLHLLHGYI
jgi:hypothetical protein